MTAETLSSAPVAVESWTLPYLEKRFAKMVKSAVRTGCAAPRLIVGETYTERQFSHENAFGEDVYTTREYTLVSVEGERPMLKGWKPLANLVKVGEFNIIRSASDLDLEGYAKKVNVCDHCGTRRQRNETWLFQHEETGEIKQVARNCVKDFIGMSDIDLKSLERWASATSLTTDSEFFSGLSANHVDVLDYLAAAQASIRVNGWISRGRALETGMQSTASHAHTVLYLHHNPERRDPGEVKNPILKEDFRYAAEALEWIRKQLETSDSNYILNAARAAQGDMVLSKLDGLLASIVGAAYPRHCKDREEKKAAEGLKVSEHVGEIKKREVFEGLTITSVNVRETEYGDQTNIWFSDKDGNVMHWRASGDRESTFKVGESYTLKATVKDHWTNNRGDKVTSVARAALL